MEDVKIELKAVSNQINELEVVKRKAEYLTKSRIRQQQEAAKLKELERAVAEPVAEPVSEPKVAPSKK